MIPSASMASASASSSSLRSRSASKAPAAETPTVPPVCVSSDQFTPTLVQQVQWRHGSLYSAATCHAWTLFITDKHNMSTNLSVIKNLRKAFNRPAEAGPRPDVQNPTALRSWALSTVALDAVGIGLIIMPVLPGLPARLVHSNDVTAHYGILLALYALMNFACAPVLGAVGSFPRRPVLLASRWPALLPTTIMATALFPGFPIYRAMPKAGITGAIRGGSRRLYCRYH